MAGWKLWAWAELMAVPPDKAAAVTVQTVMDKALNAAPLMDLLVLLLGAFVGGFGGGWCGARVRRRTYYRRGEP